MSTFEIVNNDVITSVAGDIVVSSGQAFGGKRALANSSTLALLGVWTTNTAVSKPGTVSDGLVEVNCSVTVNVGDSLYLDAANRGMATNVAPAYNYPIGIVLAKRTVSGVQKATVSWKGLGCQVTATQTSILAGKPASGNILCVGTSSIDNNDGFTISDGITPTKFEYKSVVDTKATGNILCVAKASIANNDGFTISDGATPTSFEYKSVVDAKATGSITCVGTGSILNNETFTLNDGVNAATVFEFKSVVDAKATGSITCVATESLLNNETFTLNDGVNTATVFEFKSVVDAKATGSITCVATESLLNNETFTLNDGVNTATVFEFQVDETFVAAGGDVVVVDVSTVTTAEEVAGEVKDAINAVTTTLAITAGTVVGAVVPLTNDANGNYNAAITDTVADVGFTHTGMTGGSGFVAAGGDVVVVDVSTVSTAADVAGKVKDAINAVTTTLAITAGTVTGAVVPLTNDANGNYNAAITDTVVNAGFTHTGMTGGSGFVAAGGDVVVVDVSTVSTAAAVAGKVKDAINAVTTTLAITAGTVVGAVVPLTNDANGNYNTAITDTVVNAGFTHTGMTGGSGFVPTASTTKIDITGVTSAASVATLTATAINAESLGLVIPAPSDANVAITNSAVGTAGNVAITKTAGCPLTVTGMTGGGKFTSTASTTKIDITGVTSAADVATLTAAAINGAGLTLSIPAPSDANIPIINSAVGTDGNVAITKTSGCPLTVTGMTGGVEALAA